MQAKENIMDIASEEMTPEQESAIQTLAEAKDCSLCKVYNLDNSCQFCRIYQL